MSLTEELNYFLERQIKHLKEGIFVCQTKYYQELLKRLGMEDVKSIGMPMPTNGNLERDENNKDVDVKRYRGMI